MEPPNNKPDVGKRAKTVVAKMVVENRAAESRVVAEAAPEEEAVAEARVEDRVARVEDRVARVEDRAAAPASAATKGIRRAGVHTTDHIVGACVLMTPT